jgi:hypothetical protein
MTSREAIAYYVTCLPMQRLFPRSPIGHHRTRGKRRPARYRPVARRAPMEFAVTVVSRSHPHNASRPSSLGLHFAGANRIDPDLPWPEFLCKYPRDRLDGTLGGDIHGSSRWWVPSDCRAEVGYAPSIRSKMLDDLLHCQHNTKHVNVEMLMEVILRDTLDQCKSVDTRVVHQNINPSKRVARIGQTDVRHLPTSKHHPGLLMPCHPLT